MMNVNVRPDSDLVMIRLMRPVAVAVQALDEDAPINPPLPHIMAFSRAEWALLVASGLLYAIGVHRAGGNCDNGWGWADWDKATAFRAAGVTEKDHLLIVASLFLQGYELGWANVNPLLEAEVAIGRLCRRAAEYREMEGIQSPIELGPMPRVAHFHPTGILPDPSFQATLLERTVEATHVDVLIDLAKQGEEATFKELARTLGVAADKIDELWTGTVRRVTR